MGRTRGPYDAEFPASTLVRIADRAVLDRFLREWKLHHPLDASQCAFAGRTARVTKVGFYHGADELYSLEGIPGLWHEQLLSVAAPNEPLSAPDSARGDRGRSNRLRIIAFVLGLVSAGASAYALFIGVMLLGGFTGVVAMCPTGPTWWVITFFVLVIAVPLLGGAGLGVLVGRWYFRKAHSDA
jgi:hypothetical protein